MCLEREWVNISKYKMDLLTEKVNLMTSIILEKLRQNSQNYKYCYVCGATNSRIFKRV